MHCLVLELGWMVIKRRIRCFLVWEFEQRGGYCWGGYCWVDKEVLEAGLNMEGSVFNNLHVESTFCFRCVCTYMQYTV